MKMLWLFPILVVVGCYKGKSAHEYELAGMLDDAEVAYQKEILSTDEQRFKEMLEKQRNLLNFYLRTDQLVKADRYSSILLVRKVSGELDTVGMAEMRLEVAKALYAAKNYRRAYYHYRASADFFFSDFSSKMFCEPKSIRSYYLAYESAIKAGMNDSADESKKIGIEVINSFACKDNKNAQAFITYFGH